MKKELTIALEKAIKKVEGKENKQVLKDLLNKLEKCNNIYCHYIENRCLYWWLVDHQYIAKSTIDSVGGGR